MDKRVVILVLLSRKWRVEETINQLNNLQTGKYRKSVTVIVDNPGIDVDYFKSKLKFKSKKVIRSGLKRISAINIPTRRQRIIDLLELAKNYINGKGYLFILEDDTGIKSDTLLQLEADYQMLSNKMLKVGVVSGLQAGRWGVKMIGAWMVDNINDPYIYRTVKYDTSNRKFQEVDATGLYCLITKINTFKSVTFRQNFFGADVNFGIDLRRQGYRNYVDWRVRCTHITQNDIIYVDSKCVELAYEKSNNTFNRLKL